MTSTDGQMGAASLIQRYTVGDRDFSNASLSEIRARGATLAAAGFRGADLSYADLRGCNLKGCDLSKANLNGADLSNADLEGADLGGALLGGTHLIGVDLTAFCTASPAIQHQVPSHVDHTSIIRSVQLPGLRDFLRATGMPELFAKYLVDCAKAFREPLTFSTVFISYGGPDEGFARKLNDALRRNGVSTFFFPEHAVPGMRLHRIMRDGVGAHDRILLICSKNSLNRLGVLNEISETLSREERNPGSTLLLPITLDDYVFSWNPSQTDIARAVRDRVIADFRGVEADPGKFNSGIRRLVAALKR